MTIPEKLFTNFHWFLEEGDSHDKASELANKKIDGDGGLV
tara:strand:- start:1830 stop:1949 length:120 start_codon:yes stop_codon:yes gene_type:complete